MTEWKDVKKKDIKHFDDYYEAMHFRDILLKKQR